MIYIKYEMSDCQIHLQVMRHCGNVLYSSYLSTAIRAKKLQVECNSTKKTNDLDPFYSKEHTYAAGIHNKDYGTHGTVIQLAIHYED